MDLDAHDQDKNLEDYSKMPSNPENRCKTLGLASHHEAFGLPEPGAKKATRRGRGLRRDSRASRLEL
jgi:hypothetical protein